MFITRLILAFAVAGSLSVWAQEDRLELQQPPPAKLNLADDHMANGIYSEANEAMTERDQAAIDAKIRGKDPRKDPKWQEANRRVKGLNRVYADYADRKSRK
jgi:hypothetical protein